ncbi:pre-mRNA-splicing factor prp1 [Verticillium alfalfae VaMs.102]|uniref:Pre-mRNA-splicing factor prp1 n=1 Tax=Verticillium alfalfae (strain VaMs.102 / ATCC MYA-4576 / FGSC 10136) TaxID=526221 RepID=C9S5R8_VERA1|nr:pre-mRNA-splicing factor prp1 [Verticillium alfalfae VaMs.102]EEY14294.1 pre-mRNA-splicing factor prp1 [Verticillium alfalfae VaMs.102]
MASRRDFLSQPAPENYIAGIGRGATGFTTRSDLGPAREGPSEDQIKEAVAKRAAQLGIGADGKKGDDKDDDKGGDDDRFKDPDNEVGLFAGGLYDKDDEEADRIWQEVDEKMGKRRQKQREARELAEKEEYERNNPKISQQFADLKRALGTVTDEEWASLPEVGDLTGKNKRARAALRQRQYAVPDSVLAAARDASELGTTVSDEGVAPGSDGADCTMTTFTKIGAARDKVLKSRLEQASSLGGTDTAAGSATSIDPKGYITSLDKSMMNGAQAQVADINRVRELLTSVTKTNPNSPGGWIAGARLEELAGKTVAARNVIARGCEKCPKNVDVWLENIRLNDVRNAKIIAAEAIKKNDKSVLLWVEAMRLENEPRAKKRVIRLALDHIPDSEALWKEAVNLEEDQTDARLLLAKATEIIPLSVDLWLALARLETPENAQKVLNKARKAVPTSFEIWIAAARLQEQLGASVNVMKRAVNVLVKEAAMPKREEWIAEAEKCEEEGALWMLKGQIYEDLDKLGQAREAYSTGVKAVPASVPLWLLYARLEERAGLVVKARSVLDRARLAVPKSPALWRCPRAACCGASRSGTSRRRTQRKPRSLEAIKKVDNDPILFVAVARLFWGERKLEKAQNWFEKALVLDSNNGDTWAWYYKFLLQHGTEVSEPPFGLDAGRTPPVHEANNCTQEKRGEVITKCVLVEPRHGEYWQAIAKRPANARKGTEEILNLVANSLER